MLTFNSSDIAIVGMACRFPGAPNVTAFWENLRNGVESITFFSRDQLEKAGVPSSIVHQPDYVGAEGLLENADCFDASFFGYTPREAEVMDPQQRLFLECAWEALEMAGYDPERYKGSIGVYAGTNINTYLLFNLLTNKKIIQSIGDYQARIASDKDFLSSRVSYKLNLRGPSLTIQTACSTSLVAVHMACQSLLRYECDMALAGGVSLSVPQKRGYLYQEGMIFSPDGHCRAFDANAQGTVPGNGAGIVVLKRLADALNDKDSIYAVIKGSAVNNDGSAKVGYTAPGVQGQEDVITEALTFADIDPRTISYVEAHGTATLLGDVVEITALTQAFQAVSSSRENAYCALGSVKTNIGHLDAAAGIAGLIKTVLALQHKQIPPTLHYNTPNPTFDIVNSPFYVNTKLVDWSANGSLRRAGVSSFGIGGTNAHVILEEAPSTIQQEETPQWSILPFSAKTASALAATQSQLKDYLSQHLDIPLSDIAYTLQTGRRSFEQRGFVVGKNHEHTILALEQMESERDWQYASSLYERPVAFLFPGQSVLTANMTEELYTTWKVFSEHVDRCSEILQPYLGIDLRNLLYASQEKSHEQLQRASILQPALFSVEYALAQLWMHWGVRPAAMVGHSLGEYVAACLSGVLSLEDALAIVAERGRLVEMLPQGKMLAVLLSEEHILQYTSEHISLAAVNSPEMCVVSGPCLAIEDLHDRLRVAGIPCQELASSHAFHSAMLDPILETFAQEIRKRYQGRPQIPYVSGLSGTWITEHGTLDPEYWVGHLRQPVRFYEGMCQLLLKDPEFILLEVGLGRTLSQLVRRYKEVQPSHKIVPSLTSLKNNRSGNAALLEAVGQLWQAGRPISWTNFYEEGQYQRVPLPTYPFEKLRHWIEPSLQSDVSTMLPQIAGRKLSDVTRWFYFSAWNQSIIPVIDKSDTASNSKQCWLLFLDNVEIGSQLTDYLQHTGHTIVTVSAGKEYSRLDEHAYYIAPDALADYQLLLQELELLHMVPDVVVHCWSLSPASDRVTSCDTFPTAQQHAFYGLLFLVQAITQKITNPLKMIIVSNGICKVTGDEILLPEKATILGPCKVVPQEYSNIRCHYIDIELPEQNPRKRTRVVQQLIGELSRSSADETIVAYRGEHRWVQNFIQMKQEDVLQRGNLWIRSGGVYIITGGTGRIGLKLATHVATLAHMNIKLVLIGRSPFPPENEWKDLLIEHEEEDMQTRKLRVLLALKQAGAEVSVYTTNVADAAQMKATISSILERYGEIHGVIHAAGPNKGDAFRLIAETDQVQFEALLATKVEALSVLESVLHGLHLDFCVILSSLASVLGGLGLASYTAVSNFVDVFVQRHNMYHETPWITLNMDYWRSQTRTLPPEIEARTEQQAMTTQEGIAVFDYLFHWPQFQHIIISTGNLQDRIEQWLLMKVQKQMQESIVEMHLLRVEQAGQNALFSDAPQSELEEKIATIWQELLGLKGIGIHENFFELGGHSLLASQIVFRVRTVTGVKIPLHAIFEKPTIAGMAEVIQNQNQQTLDESLLSLTIEPEPEHRHEPFPLTEMQQAYWIGRSGALAISNVSIHLYIELESEALDIERFNQVWHRLINYHDMLRAVLLPDGRQKILPVTPYYKINMVDLRKRDNDLVRMELQAIRQRMSHQRLSIDIWPPFDICAVLLDEKRVRLCFSIDGLFADGRSYYILFHQLVRLYKEPGYTLQPLTFSFRDYVQALSKLEELEVYKQTLAYWLARIPTLPPAPQLPLKAVPTTLKQYQFIRKSARLTGGTWTHLKTQTTRRGLTPTSLLLTAYAEILSRWSKSPHFTINVPIFNRLPLHPEMERIVGEFASFTLLEVDHCELATFEVRVQRIQKQLWKDLEHEYVSGVRVLREMMRQQGRSEAMPIVFTSFLNLGAAVEGGSPLEELGSVVYSIAQTPQVWLDCVVEEIGDTLLVRWDAVEALFPAGMIDDMFDSYMRLLHFLASEEQSWSTLNRQFVPARHHALYSAINATEKDYRAKESLHALFEEQVERTPEAVAVVYEDAALSYGELNRQANQLARYLQQQGVGPEVRVGLFLERSLELVIALLAILKAGGAYVPLDPTYPAARLRFMIQDAAVPFILSTEGLRQRLPEEQAGIVCVEKVRSLWKHSGENLHVVTTGENLAYVIYTSGSTGQPKGVMNTHAGICNRLLWMQDVYQLEQDDRVLQKTPYSFDVSVWEFFWPLLSGARLVVIPPEEHRNPAALVMHVIRHGITVLHFVPTMLKVWLEEPGLEQCQGIRRLICSGEALSPQVAQTFFERLPGQLHNLYGPTEVAVDVTHWECSREAAEDSIPIGQPIANTDILILDQEMALVPLWATGEIYIRGKGLARGYHGRSDLTAASFVPDPFREGEGGRLYKTGDLGRYREDGSIEYLGRVDQQVKIRGFRIELGEIEYTLCQHPAVQDAVVLQRKNNSDIVSLIAYIVLDSSLPAPTSSEELHLFLSQRLPEYMLPSAFLFLEALPHTTSGKVDRNQLPMLEGKRNDLQSNYVAPETPVEVVIADLWAGVLQLDQVGLQDNFFAIGGHSLHLIQILSHTHKLFQVDVPMQSIMQAATVQNMAQLLIEHEKYKGQVERISLVLLKIIDMSEKDRENILKLKKSNRRDD
ncbi:hypothetical protein KSF_075270 [Reticulibacter mediterranei]|uniref:Phenolphthiocerol/phthiocerol polyketide synthase subunit E n=1 Tax=Reticulibacter mediterranei TaxID=2778369 RepID=A0A8J3N3U8_9CHLR|nr:non-ribosomal peptide synthetase/type I polyketide synthase [Reticulibacter mediterranei]GHO97479.1 hypothetical protein KSF_075270 [Reticulibacter mediterranei]